ncbi:MAG: GIY-YIG nuclease family protein [Candidatus Paceibacterota bacterium]
MKSITTDKMWQVYIIKSTRYKKHYIGCTNNIERRLSEHNKGYNVATANYGPWLIVHFEKFNNQQEAYMREQKIKSFKGGNAFKKLLNL